MATVAHRPTIIITPPHAPFDPSKPGSPSQRRRPLPVPPSTNAWDATEAKPSIQHDLSPMTMSYLTLATELEESLQTSAIKNVVNPQRILEYPRILSHMLQFLPWEDFHAFASTCRDFRHIVMHPDYRDMILSRFVPGYRDSLRSRDLQQYREVEIDMHDLSLFKLSQNVPLHNYPWHALSFTGQIPLPPNAEYLTLKLISLSQAHSRFVLLLQSLIHSASDPPSPEEPDDLGGDLTRPQPEQRSAGIRELVFPAPLSFLEAGQHENQNHVSLENKAHHSRASTLPSGFRSDRSVQSHVSADFQGLIQNGNEKKRRRTTLLLRPNTRAPPPPSAPAALKYSSSTWRRTVSMTRKPDFKSSVSDDEGELGFGLPIPHRRFAAVNHSSDSSLTSPSPPSSRCNVEYSTSPHQSLSPKPSSSPHDLSMAMSRYRAPILRVFVPCIELDEVAVNGCEEQLMDAGLWEHLSSGDIICNFGFVPPQVSDDETQSSRSSSDSERSTQRRSWLMFNGYCLVHFIPPAPPPIENSITLPSPWYFSHILPPTTNPTYILSFPPLRMPHNSRRNHPFLDSQVQMTLSHLPARVRSPRSPLGYAMVKKYVWLAKLPYAGYTATVPGTQLPGEGWKGEWILEAEGTREGKQSLIDALLPGADGLGKRALWEIVKEKSGRGKLWMRLGNANVDPGHCRTDLHTLSHISKNSFSDSSRT